MYCSYKFIFRRARRIYLRFVTANVSADAAVVDLSVLLSVYPDLHCNKPDITCPYVTPGVMYVTYGFNSQLRLGLHRGEYVVRNSIAFHGKISRDRNPFDVMSTVAVLDHATAHGTGNRNF